MFCTSCGQPVDSSAQFCSACGARVGPPLDAALASSSLPPPQPALVTQSHLTMVWDKLATRTNFQFQDPSGRPLGGTQGEFAFPIKYTLFDDVGGVVLSLDAVRVRGLLFDFQIHDAGGGVLATVHQESSIMVRRYGLTVGGQGGWLLTTDAMGYHYQIEEVNGGRVLATGDRRPAVRTSITEISITDGQPLDHRVVIGAMILVCYLTTRK